MTIRLFFARLSVLPVNSASADEFTRMLTHVFLILAFVMTSATVAHAQKVNDKPAFSEYKGVRLGMDMSEARKKLGQPAEKADAQDVFLFSDKESCEVFYDNAHKVVAVSVNYVGDGSGAPSPKAVLGTDIKAGTDGSIYKLIRYPASGYWVSYKKTGGEDPITTVAMQKIQ
jgi:hypothetical protein